MSLAPIRLLPSVPAPASPASTTVGDLLEEVGGSIASAVALHRGVQHSGRRAAVCVALGYADLLGALGTLWAALWRGGVEVVEAARLGELMPASPPARLEEQTHTATTRALACAATAARSTADLIATHHGRHGGWRSPESEVLEDPGLLHGAAGVVAGQVALATSMRDTVVRALRETGVGQRTVARLVVDERELQLSATRFAWTAPPMSHRIGGLGVARPAVRNEDELGHQVLDRWRRVRTSAWELRTAPTVSLTTLTDLATAACVLNRAACSVGLPGSAPGTWRALREDLADLRTTALRCATVRTDIVVLGMLLAQLVPSRRREVVAVALAGLPQLARWSATAFSNARSHDIVYVDAARLTGSEVTDHPELVVAKLRGRLVASPASRLLAVAALYRSAAEGSRTAP